MSAANPTASPVRVAMIQDGARLHYALPAALHRVGMLERMFTDCFVRPGGRHATLVRLLGLLRPQLAAAMAGRSCTELNDAHITSSLMLALRNRRSSRRFDHQADHYLASADRVADWVLRHGLGDANAVMGYVRNIHPKLLADARRTGCAVVADQIIAPAAVELEEARRQHKRWPGFQAEPGFADLDIYTRWEEQTWPLLDRVTCASEYVKTGLVAQGVNADRIAVMPYPIDTATITAVDRSERKGPLTVGFAGSVSVRKGAPCFFETAQRFDRRQVRFVMVGPVAVDRNTVAEHGGDVELIGQVPRSKVIPLMNTFDLFFFPSTCEGSAGVVTEALASGLPVITSPNSGSVVRDSVEGFVRPCNDTDGYAAAIEQLADDHDLRRQMAQAARTRAEQFNLDSYGNELAGLFRLLIDEHEHDKHAA